MKSWCVHGQKQPHNVYITTQPHCRVKARDKNRTWCVHGQKQPHWTITIQHAGSRQAKDNLYMDKNSHTDHHIMQYSMQSQGLSKTMCTWTKTATLDHHHTACSQGRPTTMRAGTKTATLDHHHTACSQGKPKTMCTWTKIATLYTPETNTQSHKSCPR